MRAFDVQVSGAGVVGKSLALSLARLGLSVALRGEPSAATGDDARAYALNPASVDLLRRLKAWDAIAADAKTDVHDMVVRGDAGDATIEFSPGAYTYNSLRSNLQTKTRMDRISA